MMHSCDVCSYSSNLRANVQRHMLRHSDNKPFACKCCDYRARLKNNLKVHIQRHNHYDSSSPASHVPSQLTTPVAVLLPPAATPPLNGVPAAGHRCDQCGYCTRIHSNYERHLLIHRDERRYACTQCPLRFKQPTGLLNHRKTHQGGGDTALSKPYACVVCAYRCRLRSRLIAHLKIHADAKPFRCAFCSYMSEREAGLRRHMIDAHSAVINYHYRLIHENDEDTLTTSITEQDMYDDDILEIDEDTITGEIVCGNEAVDFTMKHSLTDIPRVKLEPDM